MELGGLCFDLFGDGEGGFMLACTDVDLHAGALGYG